MKTTDFNWMSGKSKICVFVFMLSVLLFATNSVHGEVLAAETFDNFIASQWTQLRFADQIQVLQEGNTRFFRLRLEPGNVELGRNFLPAHRDKVRVKFKFRWSPTMEHWVYNRTSGGTHMFNAKSATFGTSEAWIRFDFSKPYNYGLSQIAVYAGKGQPCTAPLPRGPQSPDDCNQERNLVFSNGQVPFLNGLWQELTFDINCQDGWVKLTSQGNSYTKTLNTYERNSCLRIGGIQRLSWNNYDQPTPPGGNQANSYIDFDDWSIETLPNSPPPQTCSDNTPYNQCSNTQPLFCYNNGTLGNRCQQCRCPQQQICQADGSCSGSPNQPPNATITQPTQNTFTVNTPINYAGTGTDPDGTIVSYSWTVDIIGDGQQPFTIGNQQSGTYTPTTLVNNLSTIYRLTLTVTDNDQAPGTNFKELTIVPAQQNCVLTSAQWDRTSTTEGTLVNLIVNGSNCNSKLVNFVVWEDDILDGDDPVQVNPQSIQFNNDVATATWIAEFQEDCGGACNPPEYIFIASLNDNSNVNIQSSNQLIVNRGTENQPPTVNIVSPDINSEAISFETNMLTSAYIDYGLTNSYGDRESSVTIGTAHTIFLRDLEQGRQYHYRITTTTEGGMSVSSTDRIFIFVEQQQNRCQDGTLYNQCSNTQPLFCFNNGTLGNNCQQCQCPNGLSCQPNGSCSGSPNQPPTATITQPTQNTFTVNTTINYAGTGTDPEEGNLPGSSLCWSYDITGDQQGFINLGCRISGTFTPVQSGTYILKLVATDTQGLSDSKNKTLTINPIINQTCQQQGGICCQAGYSCNGNNVGSNNCGTVCCLGSCVQAGGLSGGYALSGFWEGWRARHNIGDRFFNGPNNAYGMMGFNTYAVRRLDIGRRGWLEFDVRIEGPRPNDGKGGQHLFSVTSQAACQAGPCDPATGQNLNGWLRIDNGAAENNIVNAIYNNHGNGTLNGVRNANQQTLNAWRQWAHIRLEWEQTANNIRVKLNGRESNVPISPTSRDTGILLIVGNMDRYTGHPAPGYENLCSDANCAAGVCHCLNPDGTPIASCATCRCSAGLDPCGMIDQVWYKNFRWGR